MTIIRDRLDRLIVAFLCILIFAIPFSKSMVEIFATAAFVLWVFKRILSYQKNTSLINLLKPVDTALSLPLFLFILAGVLSTLTSTSISLSIKGLFFKLLEGAFLYFIITETVNDRKKLNIVLATMSLSMLLIGVDGIFQFFMGWDFLRHYPTYTKYGRISSSFINPNGFGGWLTIMLPLALSAVYIYKNQQPKKVIKIIPWILAGILTLCLVLTRSKGACIGVVFALIFFAMVKKHKIFLIAIALILAISFLIAACFVNIYPYVNKFIIESSGIRSSHNVISHTKFFLFFIKKQLVVPIMLKIGIARTCLWREALLIIRDFPVFGCGLNTYSIVAPHYKLYGDEAGSYCHNSYLQTTAEMGFIGLFAFISVIATLFITSLSNIKKIKNGFYNNILLGLMAGLFGFLVHSFFDVNFYALQLVNLMWFIMGLIVAVQRIALNEENKAG